MVCLPLVLVLFTVAFSSVDQCADFKAAYAATTPFPLSSDPAYAAACDTYSEQCRAALPRAFGCGSTMSASHVLSTSTGRSLSARAGADSCSSATVIPSLPFSDTGSTVGATPDGTWVCASPSNQKQDVWYSYTAVQSGLHRFSLCGSAFDTAMLILDSCNGNVIQCNDDSCGLQSSVDFTLTTGQSIVIGIAGFSSDSGSYSIMGDFIPPPTNDECINAVALGAIGVLPLRLVGNTFTATTSSPSALPNSCVTPGFTLLPGGSDIWYSFVATANVPYRINTCGSSFDNMVAIFDSCTYVTPLSCTDDGDCPGQQFVSNLLTGTLTAGNTYYLAVGGFQESRGDFVFEITAEGCGNGNNVYLRRTVDQNSACQLE